MLKTLRDLLEPALLAELETNARHVVLRADETLLSAGQTVNAIPIVTSGTLRITRRSEDGHDLLLYYLTANESCAMTFTCCMQQFPSQVTVVAEEESEVLMIPVALMDTWMQRYPSWKSFVMTTIRNRFQELLNAIDQIAFHKLDQRLLSYLREKAAVTENSELHISHEQIAMELASSREVISRLLKKMENEKMVVLGRNMIRIIQPV